MNILINYRHLDNNNSIKKIEVDSESSFVCLSGYTLKSSELEHGHLIYIFNVPCVVDSVEFSTVTTVKDIIVSKVGNYQAVKTANKESELTRIMGLIRTLILWAESHDVKFYTVIETKTRAWLLFFDGQKLHKYNYHSAHHSSHWNQIQKLNKESK